MSPDIYYNIAWVLNDENEIFYVMNEIFCVEWKILSTMMFRGEKQVEYIKYIIKSTVLFLSYT